MSVKFAEVISKVQKKLIFCAKYSAWFYLEMYMRFHLVIVLLKSRKTCFPKKIDLCMIIYFRSIVLLVSHFRVHKIHNLEDKPFSKVFNPCLEHYLKKSIIIFYTKIRFSIVKSTLKYNLKIINPIHKIKVTMKALPSHFKSISCLSNL